MVKCHRKRRRIHYGYQRVFIAKENNKIGKIRKDFIQNLNESRLKHQKPALTEEETYQIEESINDLLNLEAYQMPSLEISYAALEENVADIFVRVNSAGQKLTEKDFILTLISVYDMKMRERIDAFCSSSRTPANHTAYNHIIVVEPSHIVRIAVGFGFRRARLRYAYMILRGKDLQTETFSNETRSQNFDTLSKALDQVLDLNNWHGFLNILQDAGYVSNKLIASSNAVVFTYVLYLIAKYDYHMEKLRLHRLIRKWFFMAAITYFYTGNTESDVEKQFADMRDIQTPEQLEAYLDNKINARFTEDYFNIQLPMNFTSTASISPSWFGFIASQIVLGYPMLFSNTSIAQMFLAGVSGTKNAIDKHHLFPKNYLAQNGFPNDRDRNQNANFAYLDYTTNIFISDKAPSEYVPEFRDKLGEDFFKLSCAQHALPNGFERMKYMDFLAERRVLMAKIVRTAYERVCSL